MASRNPSSNPWSVARHLESREHDELLPLGIQGSRMHINAKLKHCTLVVPHRKQVAVSTGAAASRAGPGSVANVHLAARSAHAGCAPHGRRSDRWGHLVHGISVAFCARTEYHECIMHRITFQFNTQYRGGTLDGEDRAEIIKGEGKGDHWASHDRALARARESTGTAWLDGPGGGMDRACLSP